MPGKLKLLFQYKKWVRYITNILNSLLVCLFAGSWPLLSIMSNEDTHLNVNVERDTKGVPSYKRITFAYNGIRAPPVRANANSTEVNSPRHHIAF